MRELSGFGRKRERWEDPSAGTIEIPCGDPCSLYFIVQFDFDDVVRWAKIGISSEANKRLSSMQSGSPYPLALVGQLRLGDRVTARGWERSLHHKLRECRSEGGTEWFDYTLAVEVWNEALAGLMPEAALCSPEVPPNRDPVTGVRPTRKRPPLCGECGTTDPDRFAVSTRSRCAQCRRESMMECGECGTTDPVKFPPGHLKTCVDCRPEPKGRPPKGGPRKAHKNKGIKTGPVSADHLAAYARGPRGPQENPRKQKID